MKLHLPLSLRSALLAACALVGLCNHASATAPGYETWTGGSDRLLLESDFVIKGNDNRGSAVHSLQNPDSHSSFMLDGNERRYSYLLEDIQSAWLDSSSEKKIGTLDMINMDQVFISGVVANQYNIFNINIANSNSFSFSYGSSSNSLPLLIRNASFSLSYVDNVSFSHNQGNIFKETTSATFENIKKFVYENNKGTFALYTSLGKGTDHPLRGPIFNNCEEILITNNEADRGLITYHTNPRAGNATGWSIFENCGTVVFSGNTLTERDLFSSIEAMFINCGVVEFTNNTAKESSLIGRELVAENITTLRINDNQVYHPDTNLAATGMLLGDSNAIYPAHALVASGDQTKSVLEIKNNKGEGRFKYMVSKSIEASQFKKIDISGNSLDFITETVLTNAIASTSVSHVDEILISKNRVSGGNTIKGLIGFTGFNDIGTLEISDNIIGLDADGNIITQSTANAETALLAGNTLVGRSDNGVLSSIVRINDNVISVLKFGTNASSVIKSMANTYKDLHSLEIKGNAVNNAYRWLGDGISLSNVENVTISDNTLTVSGNISTADVVLNSVDLTNAASVVIKGNTTTGTGNVGGALALRFSNTEDINKISAAKVEISNNKAIGANAYGGAIRGTAGGKNYLLQLTDGGEISIRDNGAEGESIEKARGGAIYSSVNKTLEIANNDRVVIEGNYITDGEVYRLNAIDIAGELSLKSGAGQSIEIYDSVTTSGALNINKDSANMGEVTFSGVNTARDLAKFGKGYSEADLEASRTIQAAEVHIYNGSVALEEGMKLVATGSKGISSSGEAQLKMNNATLSAKNTNATIEIANAIFEGSNKIEGSKISGIGGVWTFNIGRQNQEEAVLSIEFTAKSNNRLSSENQSIQVQASSSTLTRGAYKLLEYDAGIGSWIGSEDVIYIGSESEKLGEKGKDDIYYTIDSSNIYTLWYEYNGQQAGEPGEPGRRKATTLSWVGGAGEWSEGSGGDGSWTGKQGITDYNYYNGDSVIFSSAAEVSVKGYVRPADILVNNQEGQVSIRGEEGGQLTGSTALTKDGAGELALWSANAYSGATVIKDGRVIIGDAHALGLGEVKLQGGSLELGGYSVGNSIEVSGESEVNGGSKYEGKLRLTGGALRGGELQLAQDAELVSGSISNALSGDGGIEKSGSGRVELSGELSYKGGTSIQEGTLALIDTDYRGSVSIASGSELELTGSEVHGQIWLGERGRISVDEQRIEEGDKLISEGGGIINGDLELAGGDLELGGELIVSGSVSSSERTGIQLNSTELLEKGEVTLIRGGDTSGVKGEHLWLNELEKSRIEKRIGEDRVSVGLSRVELEWKPGEMKQWGVLDEGEWESKEGVSDKRFHNLDQVIFRNSGDVTIVGEVMPGGIKVEGEQDTRMIGEGGLIGEGHLEKSGSGTLELATNNSGYSGEIRVRGGSLKVGHEQGLGQGNISIENARFNAGGYTVSNRVELRGESALQNAAGVRDITISTGSVSGSYHLGVGNHLSIGEQGAIFSGSLTFAGGTLTLTGGIFNVSGESIFDDGVISASGQQSIAQSGEGQKTVIDLSRWGELKTGDRLELIELKSDKDAAEHFELSGLEEGLMKRAKLEYTQDALWLEIKAANMNAELLPYLNRNQKAAYAAFEEIAGSGEAKGELSAIAEKVMNTSDAASLSALLDKVSGAELAGMMLSMQEGNLTHLRRLHSQICSGQKLGIGANSTLSFAAYDDIQEIDADDFGQGIKRNEWGGMLTAEMKFGNSIEFDNLTVGVALTGGRAQVKPSGSDEHYYDTLGRVDAYLIIDFRNGWKNTASVGVSVDNFRVKRKTLGFVPGSITELGEKNPHIDALGFALTFSDEISYTANLTEKTELTLFGSVQSSLGRIGSFEESMEDDEDDWGWGVGKEPEAGALEGTANTSWSTDVMLGMRLSQHFTGAARRTGTLSVQGGVVASIADIGSEQELKFHGAPNTKYQVNSARRERVGYNLGASLYVPLTKDAALMMSGSVIMRSGSSETSANVGVRMDF